MKATQQFFVLFLAFVIFGLSNPSVAVAQQVHMASTSVTPNAKGDIWKTLFRKKEDKAEKKANIGIFKNASFPKLAKYLETNLVYPYAIHENLLEGTVYAQVEISAIGDVTSVTTVKGIDAGCDRAVEKVLSGMPRWQPATWNGKPHDVKLIVKVKFCSTN